MPHTKAMAPPTMEAMATIVVVRDRPPRGGSPLSTTWPRGSSPSGSRRRPGSLWMALTAGPPLAPGGR